MPIVLPGKVAAVPKRPKSEISISFGDHVTIHGDFVVANKIKDSFNKADSAAISTNLKDLLKQLIADVGVMSEQMPKEQAEQVANDLQTLTNEATSEKPRRRWWELSAEGLREVAIAMGQIGIPVLKGINEIVPLLENLS